MSLAMAFFLAALDYRIKQLEIYIITMDDGNKQNTRDRAVPNLLGAWPLKTISDIGNFT